jgi:membrane AbrB-like protein
MMRARPSALKQGLALLAMGAAGALTAQEIGIPAGMIVGALLSSGFYRLAGGEPGPWRGRYGRVGRLLLGTCIGAAFGPDVLAPLKAALLPMAALIAVIVGVGLGLGWALGHFTALDASTALVSSIPGGLPAMAAIAEETEADATVVAAVHFARLTTVLIAAPLLVPLLTTTPAGGGAAAPLAGIEAVGLWGTVVTLAVGLIGGALALRGGIPSGDLIGSILGVGGANLLGAGLGPLDGAFRSAAMLLIGTAVGAQMSRESLRLLRQVVLPVMVFVVIIIGVGLLLGWCLSQVTPLDLPTALLSSVPGGASTMPAVAHDLGGDMRLVAALHLMRQLVVFILVPAALSRQLRGKHQGPVALQKPISNG